jgi:hypothetical protein
MATLAFASRPISRQNLDVAAGLAFEPPARLHLIEIAVHIDASAFW